MRGRIVDALELRVDAVAGGAGEEGRVGEAAEGNQEVVVAHAEEIVGEEWCCSELLVGDCCGFQLRPASLT